jgi:hypothetical protein
MQCFEISANFYSTYLLNTCYLIPIALNFVLYDRA